MRPTLRPIKGIPANTRYVPKIGSMLGQRRRQWANNELTSGELNVLYFHLVVKRVFFFE